MEMMPEHFPFRDQLRILIDALPSPDGSSYTLAAIAQATNLTEKSIRYMLSGRTQNPHLDTLRHLCRFYQISLDYFECNSEEECRAFLGQNAALHASDVVREIDQQAETLTPSAKNNVLRLLERFRSLRSSRKQPGEND